LIKQYKIGGEGGSLTIYISIWFNYHCNNRYAR